VELIGTSYLADGSALVGAVAGRATAVPDLGPLAAAAFNLFREDTS
jgi:hypothetical protein